MRTLLVIASLATCALAAPALASTIADPSDDFLLSFTGTHEADLDVLSFSVDYDAVAAQFILGATLAGAIDPAKAGFYVIGVNTGTGPIAPFGSIGAPNVRFNQAIVVQKDGTGLVFGGPALDPALIAILGDSFTVRVPVALLPSTGFDPERYGFNLWPRIGLGDNSEIADFAPNDGTIAAVPEPATWAMMIAGFGLLGARIRHRRRAWA